MIASFPVLREDQLLYDACGIFQDSMAYPSDSTALRVLFGEKRTTATYDFPSQLQIFLDNLPPNPYTVDQLIDQHTLLPFYAPFLSPERLRTIRHKMASDYRYAISTSFGNYTHKTKVLLPTHFRFCPRCVEDDRASGGYCFWHCTHQLPGIEVCWKHCVWLVTSDVPLKPEQEKMSFVSVESSLTGTTDARPLDLTNKYEALQFLLAKAASWLLRQPNFEFGPEEISKRVKMRLTDLGYATVYGVPNLIELTQAIKDYYGDEVLLGLGASLEGKSTDWIRKVIYGKDISLPPILYVLLFNFLGCSIEEFFAVEPEYNPFGKGPWPCFNPVADHPHKANTIHSCRVNSVYVGDLRRIEGTFICDCGFTYRVQYGHAFPNTYIRTSNIIDFGEIWKTQFINGWSDPTVSSTILFRQFRLSSEAANRLALSLGLTVPRSRRQNRELSQTRSEINDRKVAQIDIKRQEWLEIREAHPEMSRSDLNRNFSVYHWLWENDKQWLMDHLPPVRDKSHGKKAAQIAMKRKEWLEIREAHPEMSRSDLNRNFRAYHWLWENDKQWLMDHLPPASEKFRRRRGTGFEQIRQEYRRKFEHLLAADPSATRTELIEADYNGYAWLHKNDREWLESKMPPRKPREQGRSPEEWAEIDSALYELMAQAWDFVKDQSGELQRITMPLLAKAINYDARFIARSIDKLPHTAQLLDELVESGDDFALRKLAASVKHFQNQGKVPTKTELITHARLKGNYNHPKVASRIEIALNGLRSGKRRKP